MVLEGFHFVPIIGHSVIAIMAVNNRSPPTSHFRHGNMKLCEEPDRIPPILAANHEIVTESHDDNMSSRISAPPLVRLPTDPSVVKVDVC